MCHSIFLGVELTTYELQHLPFFHGTFLMGYSVALTISSLSDLNQKMYTKKKKKKKKYEEA